MRGIGCGLLAMLWAWAAPPGLGAPAREPKVLSVEVMGIGEPRFVPGTRAALRVLVRGVTSVLSSEPLPLAALELRLKGPQREALLFSGRSDLMGTLDLRFDVPDWPDGDYTMALLARTPFGNRELEHAVTLNRAGRILLTTDRTRYRPGQRMQLRVLLLNVMDLKPLAGEPVQLRVLDPANNPVLVATPGTSAFGVAETTFTWPAEIHPGAYRVEASPARRELAAVSSRTVWMQPGGEAAHPGVPDTPEAPRTRVPLRAEIPPVASPAPGPALRLRLVPEGGRVVAGVENRLLVIATTADGKPARVTASVHHGDAKLADLRTDGTGLAEFPFTPALESLREEGAPSMTRALDLRWVAQDGRGNRGEATQSFRVDPERDRILVRLDKAILAGGEALTGTVLDSGGGAVCYLDVIRNRQTLLTRVVPLQGGRGDFRIPVPRDAFGTLEVHAYTLGQDGGMTRDARVLYVQPPGALTLTVAQDRPVYRPGETARFRFLVTDASGRPTPAALGLIVEKPAAEDPSGGRPGMEKVFYTLEGEPERSCTPVEPWPSLEDLIRAQRLDGSRQLAAKVWLAGRAPQAHPAPWTNPAAGRLALAEQDHWVIQGALYSWTSQGRPLGDREANGVWRYHRGLLSEIQASGGLTQEQVTDPLGAPYAVDDIGVLWPDLEPGVFLASLELGRLWNIRSLVTSEVFQRTANLTRLAGKRLATHIQESFLHLVTQRGLGGEGLRSVTGEVFELRDLEGLPGFSPKDLASLGLWPRIRKVFQALSQYGREGERWYRVSVYDPDRDVYRLPADVLTRLLLRGQLAAQDVQDFWGRPLTVREKGQPAETPDIDARLRLVEIASAGEDGELGTPDDLVFDQAWSDQAASWAALASALGLDTRAQKRLSGDHGVAPATPSIPGKSVAEPACPEAPGDRGGDGAGETLWFVPQLLTDERGVAELSLPLPESITAWRMTVSAHSRGGDLGAVGHVVRVVDASTAARGSTPLQVR